MPVTPEQPGLATPDRLEESFENLKVVNGGKEYDALQTFLGIDELRVMGTHLIEHMRDEERWGGFNTEFEPMDFVVAAHEVAHDQVAGRSDKTGVHVNERQPIKMAVGIFINFWLPRIAQVAYGDEYAGKVRSIIGETQ